MTPAAKKTAAKKPAAKKTAAKKTTPKKTTAKPYVGTTTTTVGADAKVTYHVKPSLKDAAQAVVDYCESRGFFEHVEDRIWLEVPAQSVVDLKAAL
jgi:hypothetical protein